MRKSGPIGPSMLAREHDEASLSAIANIGKKRSAVKASRAQLNSIKRQQGDHEDRPGPTLRLAQASDEPASRAAVASHELNIRRDPLAVAVDLDNQVRVGSPQRKPDKISGEPGRSSNHPHARRRRLLP
jgi:hypothetical protein